MHAEARRRLQFRFEPGLPEKIASDLLDTTPAGGVLPALQLVCGRLHGYIAEKDDPERVITARLYKQRGGIAGSIEAHIDDTLLQTCRHSGLSGQRAETELEKWKRVLVALARGHPDGSAIAEFVTEEQLRQSAGSKGCTVDFDVMLNSLCDVEDPLCRRAKVLHRGTEDVLDGFSVGHDAIGLALVRWQEVSRRRRPFAVKTSRIIDQILARQRVAKEVVIVNPETLEASEHPRARDFQDAMFDTIRDGSGTYTFILDRDDAAAAVSHWNATLMGLARVEGLDMQVPDERSQAEATLLQLEAEGRLVVRGADRSSCVFRVVAFDPFAAERCVYVRDWWWDTKAKIQNDTALLAPSATRRWVDTTCMFPF